MKEYIKGRWFPLTVVSLIVAAVVIVMVLLGWRITYAPELNISWDAISAVAAWAGVLVSSIGVIASFIAIWYAIQIPQKIADRQDKIALFEKRYECFQVFQKCYILYKYSKDEHLRDSITRQCCYILGVERVEEINSFIFQKSFQYFLG